jgi:uncharacterized protein YdaU (DUF1376 family)
MPLQHTTRSSRKARADEADAGFVHMGETDGAVRRAIRETTARRTGGAMNNIWYARYPGDYGRDTAHLSLVEHGAYTLLLDHYYSTCAPLPSDISALYRICRAFDETEQRAVNSILGQFFHLDANTYHNSRADVELIRRAEQHQRLSNSGKRGAEKRWAEDAPARRPTDGPAIASPQSQSSVTTISKERKAI